MTVSNPDGALAERVARWAAAGERYEVEFKSELLRPLNDRDLVEAVVCLANGHGGVLLVGVEDDGTVTGAQPRHEAGRTDPFRVQALVANMTQPPVSAVVSVAEVAGPARPADGPGAPWRPRPRPGRCCRAARAGWRPGSAAAVSPAARASRRR